MKQSEIKLLLPDIFQRTARAGNPLHALLATMEMLHAPAEEALQDLDQYFHPYRAPDSFVPYLASWVDLDWLLLDDEGDPVRRSPGPFPAGTGRLRELMAAAAYLSRWRGTSRGLLRFLETATGVQGYSIEENPLGDDGRPRPFHLLIRVPAEAQQYEQLIRRVIDMQKPAYVTYELAKPGS